MTQAGIAIPAFDDVDNGELDRLRGDLLAAQQLLKLAVMALEHTAAHSGLVKSISEFQQTQHSE